MSLLKLGVVAASLTALVVATSCQKSETAAAPAAEKASAPTASAGSTSSTAATASAPAATKAAATSSAPALPAGVTKLFGRWLRADGGYVLELKSADLSGAMDAAYYNPKSIHVSRAVWMQGGSGLQVAVELNDVGYPGATYVLTHDVPNDRLVGQYTQPQMQQTFDIEFVRQPKP